ncbi:hypothetical protein [Mucilaginibacter aquaedulcis]|uniref:hypothetical protein n=1 Tax=Mucilaginibacter aquaedulcis TaxID=1187081 RepID=UPI0025B29643|nr:hypothetical protein [Mucilaginibacter aquaedulcis]MDN3548894.1 hypothetical protein [Mucilaginibacter aquaedulcis]
MAPKYVFLHADSVFIKERIAKYGSNEVKSLLYNMRGIRISGTHPTCFEQM